MRRVLATVGLALLAGFGAGFVWFVASAQSEGGLPPAADGIVVLTGGAERVRTGLDLLREGRGTVLLISGVAPGVELADILHSVGLPADTLADRVTLGRGAVDTEGNARETAEWARARGLRSLIVVTATYHMKRAMIDMGRLLPGVRLIPDPVVPPALRGEASLGTLRLLFGEYVKWIAASLGLRRAPA